MKATCDFVRKEQAFRLFIIDETGESICAPRVLGRLIRTTDGLVFNCNQTQRFQNWDAFGVWPELALRILPELHIARYEIEHAGQRYVTSMATIIENGMRGVAPFPLVKGGEIEVPMLYLSTKFWTVDLPIGIKRFIQRESRLVYTYKPEAKPVTLPVASTTQMAMGF